MSYHDAFWIDEKEGWPEIDTDGFIESMKRMLKPGGKLLIVDHNAPAGTGAEMAGKAHRLNEDFAKKSLTSHGFVLEKTYDGLRNKDDQLDKMVFDPAVQRQDRSLRAPLQGEVIMARSTADQVAIARWRRSGSRGPGAAAAARAVAGERRRRRARSRGSSDDWDKAIVRKDEKAIAGNMAEGFPHHRRLRQRRTEKAAFVRRHHRSRSSPSIRTPSRNSSVRLYGDTALLIGPHAHDRQVRRQAVSNRTTATSTSTCGANGAVENRERADHEAADRRG